MDCKCISAVFNVEIQILVGSMLAKSLNSHESWAVPRVLVFAPKITEDLPILTIICLLETSSCNRIGNLPGNGHGVMGIDRIRLEMVGESAQNEFVNDTITQSVCLLRSGEISPHTILAVQLGRTEPHCNPKL